jgi:3-methyladenine DNA glycosylase/8-oxoguanine DNA glycosylase
MSMVETVYRPRHPLNLRRTLSPLIRGGTDPTHRWDGQALWRTVNTPEGAATLHVEQHGDEVHAMAWGPGAEVVIAGVPELCGEGDHWEDLDLSPHPFLREVLRTVPGLRLTRTNFVLEALIAAIFEQKVTSIEARHGWRAIIQRFGTDPPGPAPQGMRVFPASEVWRGIPSWEWHRAGVGPQRAQTIVRVAAVAAALERTLGLGRGGTEVHRRLRSLPGVGVWTSAETTQRAHGDPDAPSVCDYHLPSVVGYALTGSAVDDDGMLELLEPYAGHRQRVVRLIELTGVREPRRGPHIKLRDYRQL